ncbi:MAG: CBS domain-containing protein [Clostridia bacterium]|nr:CBS domain-containing protein [Clostridia bacterium]
MNVPMLLTPKASTSYIEYGMTVRQGLERFRAHGFTAVPVLNDDGIYMGTVSDGDFLRYILDAGELSLKKMEDVRISDILKPDVVPPVSIDASIDRLTDRLMNSNFVPVTDARGCYVGIVTRKNLMSYLKSQTDK